MAKQTRIVDVRVTSNVGGEMKKGTVAAGGLSGALKGVASSASLATGGIRAMTMALISSGIGAIVVAVGALIGGITGLISKSREFSVAMSNLKAVSGATDEQFQQLKDNAIALGSSTAFTATQVAELQTEFAKLGFTTPQIIAVSEATLDLAAATGTDLAEAAAVAGATLKGFGMTADETGRMADVMAKSFSSSALDMEKFRESMKLVAPIAATVKVPIEQATAALSVLADRGVAGSMAGTQLRRIMSDLAQKTGKDFATSLQISADRLANASSEAEKLAIAKELVGDRAKGSLIALAENREEIDRLTKAYEESGGAAKEMAEIQLDNLDGSITKLSSAWDGFMLSMEDGNGILSKIARGAVDLLTNGIAGLKRGLDDLSVGWIRTVQLGELAGVWFESIPSQIREAYLSMQEFGLEVRLALEKVPFWGNAEDTANINAQLEVVRAQQKLALQDAQKFADRYEEINVNAEKQIYDIRFAKNKQAATDDLELRKSAVEEFREGEAAGDDEAAKKALEDRKAFLEKLNDLEKKEQAKTAAEKVEYNRQKHLAELEEIKATTEEKNALRDRINKIYDDQQIALEDERKEKLAQRIAKEEMDAMTNEAEKKKMAITIAEEETLRELERLGASEEEKTRIRQMYADKRKAIDQDETDKRKELEQEVTQAKMQMAAQALDAIASLANAFAGESEQAARKNFNIQKALSLASATISGVEGTINAYTTAQKSPITALFPGYPALQAGIAGVAAAAKIATIAKTKFRGGGDRGASNQESVTGGSAGAQAPSFNVLGATSAGDELIASTVGRVNSQPVRAFVVESEISSQQSLSRHAQTSASIG